MFDFNQKKAEKKWNKLYARYIQKPKAKKAKNGQQMNDAPSPYQVKDVYKRQVRAQRPRIAKR